MEEKLIIELEGIIQKAKGFPFEGYIFYSGMDYKCELQEYKGIKIIYSSLIPNNLVFYANSIYYNI